MASSGVVARRPRLLGKCVRSHSFRRGGDGTGAAVILAHRSPGSAIHEGAGTRGPAPPSTLHQGGGLYEQRLPLQEIGFDVDDEPPAPVAVRVTV